MGIGVHGLLLRKYASERLPLKNIITIGRQELHISETNVKKLLNLKYYKHEKYCEDLLLRVMNASKVSSLDNSNYEGSTYVFDMNKEISEDLQDKFNTVIDFGALEHIYNTPQALKNISTMCKIGGQILHILPANNFCGHGFYQFSPELFFSLYSEQNGYSETEIFLAAVPETNEWFRVIKPKNGLRVNVLSKKPLHVVVRTVLSERIFIKDIQQSDYIYAWGADFNMKNNNSFPKQVIIKFVKNMPYIRDALTRINQNYFHNVSIFLNILFNYFLVNLFLITDFGPTTFDNLFPLVAEFSNLGKN